MIDRWLEPFELPDKTVYCPECWEEVFINDKFQIECTNCDRCFEIDDESTYLEEEYGS